LSQQQAADVRDAYAMWVYCLPALPTPPERLRLRGSSLQLDGGTRRIHMSTAGDEPQPRNYAATPPLQHLSVTSRACSPAPPRLAHELCIHDTRTAKTLELPFSRRSRHSLRSTSISSMHSTRTSFDSCSHSLSRARAKRAQFLSLSPPPFLPPSSDRRLSRD
jgi:hypothetical protein